MHYYFRPNVQPLLDGDPLWWACLIGIGIASVVWWIRQRKGKS